MIADDRAPAAPTPEPDRTPRANRILAEPATAARCAEDYASSGTVRETCAKQTRRR
ncbi:hypothetical protein AB0O20_27665 [Streptomyces kronopolitis]|uniref:hypothetical protein n=1 Tax=Streptomyces kronopolitis TaxID=1612435 RepID=UPI0034305014